MKRLKIKKWLGISGGIAKELEETWQLTAVVEEFLHFYIYETIVGEDVSKANRDALPGCHDNEFEAKVLSLLILLQENYESIYGKYITKQAKEGDLKSYSENLKLYKEKGDGKAYILPYILQDIPEKYWLKDEEPETTKKLIYGDD